ncbi:glycosyltransferase family 32 protein [Sinomicrobium oceani]|uniref:glycosyltransferase family 32 protein n=1 Tax=Sinomicrobium oceani TaxID=1150368 RepID=UPI00227BBA32|nr:glycosyltransferase [Sinomicrobium oceani]
MKIPKILHQTWKNENYPEHFKPLVKSWIENHPDWEYRLWTDEMNRNFIKENYPDFLNTFDNYPVPIQKADAIRYFILFHYGGLYVDIDSEAFRNVESILTGQEECVFVKEPQEHANIHNKKFIISNAFMASTPKSHFLKEIICDLMFHKTQNTDINTYVLETTGPFMLTRIYNESNFKPSIKVLNNDLIYPLSSEEASKVLSNEISKDIQTKIDKAYAIHYFFGTWWK